MSQNKSKKKLEINSYQSTSERDLTKNKKNNIIKTSSALDYRIKKRKNFSKKDFRKKDYIISIDNILNEIKEKVKSKQSKILSKIKLTEISNYKNISKEKTKNNTFNTNNTYSNTNNNINQNSNSNNTYINVAINTSNEDEISKIEENLENNKKLKNIDKNSKQIKLKTFSDFNISNDNYFNSSNQKLHTFRKYYSMNDKIKEIDKMKKELFLSSNKFYLHNKERGIKNLIKQLQNKDIENELKKLGYDYTGNKKMNYYSDLKRLPTQVCFGKGLSSMKEEDEEKEIYENKFLKNLESKNKENKMNDINFNKLITKGFGDSKKNINKYDIIFKNKLIINSNSTKKYKKKNQIITGQNLYPLLKQKKILKNILPKGIDYNTQFSINDVINDEIHPLYRYQKKNLTFHSGLISHEINFLFVKTFSLGKMVDKQKDIINKKMDEKFNIFSKNLIEKSKEMGQGQKKLTDKENMELMRKKYILKKFENLIKRAFYRFRRMKIDIRKFIDITKDDVPIKYSEGLYLFKAIKDGDLENIEEIIKKNYNYALFRDEFGQTAMHICAKRNIYQVVQLLISRLGDINAQDIYGRTPLMCAVENKHLEIIYVLLLNYADPDIKDNYGKKAVDYVNIDNRIKEKIDYKMERILKSIRLVYLFNRMMVNEKDFDTFVKNSLKYLFREEIGINFDQLIKENEEVLNDNKEKKYF